LLLGGGIRSFRDEEVGFAHAAATLRRLDEGKIPPDGLLGNTAPSGSNRDRHDRFGGSESKFFRRSTYRTFRRLR
jgi:hypothetical protein